VDVKPSLIPVDTDLYATPAYTERITQPTGGGLPTAAEGAEPPWSVPPVPRDWRAPPSCEAWIFQPL